MKLPSVPWKNIAAIGGAVRISVVRIRPMPPCCSAMLDMPSLKFSPNGLPSNELPQKAPASLATISIAMVVIAASTAIENIVPIPYMSHFWNSCFVPKERYRAFLRHLYQEIPTRPLAYNVAFRPRKHDAAVKAKR